MSVMSHLQEVVTGEASGEQCAMSAGQVARRHVHPKAMPLPMGSPVALRQQLVCARVLRVEGPHLQVRGRK